MEVHAGEGVLRFFQYVADRTDIALGMFNSPSSGYVLTPPRWRGSTTRSPRSSRSRKESWTASPTPALHAAGARAGDLGVRHDRLPGRLAQRASSVRPSSAPPAYLFETPEKPRYTRVLGADLGGPDRRVRPHTSPAWSRSRPRSAPGQPRTRAAPNTSPTGPRLPVCGVDHRPARRRLPARRPPQGVLPEEAKTQIRPGV